METEEAAASPTSGGEAGEELKGYQEEQWVPGGWGSLPMGDVEGQTNGIKDSCRPRP